MSEFYVGYLPTAPRGIASVVRRVVIGLLVAGPLVAGVLVVSQHAYPPAVFEFGNTAEYQGTVQLDPFPMLLVDQPEAPGDMASRYLLTVPGKYGAHRTVADFDGQSVRVDATLIYRDNTTMLEIVPGSIGAVGEGSVVGAGTVVSHGRVSLAGEIVDGKCYLGVMNPGEGKPHRACAARCISGGAPPLLIIGDETGTHRHLVVVGLDTEDLIPFVAEPVEVTGELQQAGDIWLIHATAGAIRRLP